MMTSLAFILGVVPLVVAEGAGAEMRRTLGTAVFSGMLGVTLFGIFLTPVFFYVIQAVSDWRGARKSPAQTVVCPSEQQPRESVSPALPEPEEEAGPGTTRVATPLVGLPWFVGDSTNEEA